MGNIDKNNVLTDDYFSYRINKDNKVFISCEGKQVVILSGKKAESFIAKIRNLEGKEVQLALAKITGNFKRGNERIAKNSAKYV